MSLPHSDALTCTYTCIICKWQLDIYFCLSHTRFFTRSCTVRFFFSFTTTVVYLSLEFEVFATLNFLPPTFFPSYL